MFCFSDKVLRRNVHQNGDYTVRMVSLAGQINKDILIHFPFFRRQCRKADEYGRDGFPRYHLASAPGIESIGTYFEQSPYRDTIFKLLPSGTIVFYHGSPRQKREYDKAPTKQKNRME